MVQYDETSKKWIPGEFMSDEEMESRGSRQEAGDSVGEGADEDEESESSK